MNDLFHVPGLTKKFYDTMMKFCFPERDTENIEGDGSREMENTANGNNTSGKKSKFSNSNEKSSKKWKETNFYVPITMKDDVEKMKVAFPFLLQLPHLSSIKNFNYSDL